MKRMIASVLEDFDQLPLNRKEEERLEELERNFLKIFGILLMFNIIYLPLFERAVTWNFPAKITGTIC